MTKVKELKSRLEGVVKDARDVMEAAESEEREWSDDERKSINESLAEAKSIRDQILEQSKDEQVKAALAGIGDGILEGPAERDAATRAKLAIDAGRGMTLGKMFVESDGYKTLIERGLDGEGWSTGPISIPTDEQGIKSLLDVGLKTLLTEGAGSGANLLQPDVQAGVLPLLFRRLTIADLMPSGTLDGNLLRYLVETTFTNAAAAVAEGGTKPESALVFSQVDEPIKKIAHVLPVTDEMLEDYSAIRSFIDARMTLGIQLTEEDQLLNGSGVGANMTGILNRAGLATAVPRGTDTNADAIFKQVTAIMVASFMVPDAVVIHPTNWQSIRLSKNANGDYYAGGPFTDGLTPNIWGLRAVVTPAITAATALVGAFAAAAQVFRKGGITIDASNSHSTFFVENKTMIRAEERLGLAVYRPGAFGTVTGLT